MTRRRRLLLGAAAGAMLLGSVGGARALIPVWDGGAIAELIAQVGEQEKAFALQMTKYALQIKQYTGEYFGWVTQYGQYVTQLAQYYNEGMQLLAIAHHPTLGAAAGLMNQAGLNNSLPFSPYAAMNLLNGSSYAGGGFAGIGGILNSLSDFAGSSYQQNRLYTPTDASWASQQVIANGNSVSAEQGAAMASYQDYRNHMGVLPALRQTAATSDTVKDAADTGNQIAIETAWNLNQLGQANAVAWMAAQQREAKVQRAEERLSCELEQFRSAAPVPCPTGDNGALGGGGGSPNGGSAAMQVAVPAPLVGIGGNPIVMQPTMPDPPVPPAQPPPFEQPAPPPALTQANNPPPQQPPVQAQ